MAISGRDKVKNRLIFALYAIMLGAIVPLPGFLKENKAAGAPAEKTAEAAN